MEEEEVVAMVIGPDVKCSLQYVHSVAKILKCHLSPAKVGRCIVVSATIR